MKHNLPFFIDSILTNNLKLYIDLSVSTKSKNLYENCKVMKVNLPKPNFDKDDRYSRMETSTYRSSVEQDLTEQAMITTEISMNPP